MATPTAPFTSTARGKPPGKWNDARGNTGCGAFDCIDFPFQGYVVEFEPSVITIQACVTGVPDRPLPDGSSTFGLALNACAQANPKKSWGLRELRGRRDGCLGVSRPPDRSTKGAIQSCAARSSIGK